ncbi:MAG: hypothetical protein ACLPY1_23660 [Terracidiphilus sp.]
MSTSAFTQFHVILSLIGIAAGLVALVGLIANRLLSAVTALFLITTVLTSVTGFLFPFKGVTPGIILGILSIIALVLAIAALYVGKLAGAWRGTYIISAGIALWFNVFVLFAQSFAKIPALHAIAPTQASPAFGITQVVVLVVFIFLTRRAFKRFHPA